MGYDPRLGGRPRTRCKQIVRARKLPCPMCGYPIDQDANRHGKRHPLSSVVDEWLPRTLGGNPHNPDHCVEMHSLCNGIKADHWPVTAELQAKCRQAVQRILEEPTGPPEVANAW